jgi:Fe/S biogenesis protein NfuA
MFATVHRRAVGGGKHIEGHGITLGSCECGSITRLLLSLPAPSMIQISDSTQQYFAKLIRQQGGAAVGIRLSALRPGTPSADARLEFCDDTDLLGDEWEIECEGFSLFVDAASVPWFDGAEIELTEVASGGQVNIRAPRIKGRTPGADSSLVERVGHVLDHEINPQLASHGGRVAVEEITAEGVVILRFGGGCHGCGQVDVTLKQGVETTLRARFPEISAVQDATDHDTGSNPYYRRHGNSPA